MVFAWALILLVVATVVFHFASPWWFTEIASNWTTMDQTVNVTFWVTGFVFVVVNLFMAWAVIRYRHRKGKTEKADYEPENKKLEWWLTIITSVGIAAMLAPGLAVWAKFVTPPEDASIIEVVGQQWAWSYRLPGRDGELGESDMKLVTLDNPLGVDPQGSEVERRRDHHLARGAPADGQGREVPAAREGREPPVRRAAVPRQDGHGARHGHAFLADADPHRLLRRTVRAAVRRRALRHARPRGGRRRGEVPGVARGAADVLAIGRAGRR